MKKVQCVWLSDCIAGCWCFCYFFLGDKVHEVTRKENEVHKRQVCVPSAVDLLPSSGQSLVSTARPAVFCSSLPESNRCSNLHARTCTKERLACSGHCGKEGIGNGHSGKHSYVLVLLFPYSRAWAYSVTIFVFFSGNLSASLPLFKMALQRDFSLNYKQQTYTYTF